MKLHAIALVVSILAATAVGHAAEVGEHADFRGYHLFQILTPQPGDTMPRLVLTRSVPTDQYRGTMRPNPNGKILTLTADEPRGVESDAYLYQHDGFQALNEELQLGRMQPWGAMQVQGARFQAIRTLARRGFLARPYAEHALTHYARPLGLDVSFEPGKPFGRIVKPAACASCGQRLPRTR